MKIKLLSTIIAGVILAGCGSDNNNTVTPEVKAKDVQAYDGAINGMVATYDCEGETVATTKAKTDGKGYVTITNNTFADNPEKCAVSLTVPKGGKAYDMSNSKDMSNVSYSIPKGLLEPGRKAAATPFTTLVDKAIKDSGETNSENVDINSIINDVFTELGIDTSVVDPKDLMCSPAETLETLDATVAQDIVAKTMVLSDVLVANPEQELSDITTVTKTIAKDIINKNPEFPTQTGSDKPIYVDLTDELADENTFKEAASGKVPTDIAKATKPENIVVGEVLDPVNPPVDPTPDAPTGGTGGDDGDNPNG
ncbi:hypothetical protein [Photobacterium leiognathi]|uniref:hypothetical protein n=1 Tax=Photobacterium leiognathi TaxID=553611 RepID=UPI002981E5D3|nr:hypothetical protein [Photobacterium leiognathi]